MEFSAGRIWPPQTGQVLVSRSMILFDMALDDSDKQEIAALINETVKAALNGNGAVAPPIAAPMPPTNASDAALTGDEALLRKYQTMTRSRRLRTTMEPWEVEDAHNLFFRDAWNRHMQHRATGKGDFGSIFK